MSLPTSHFVSRKDILSAGLGITAEDLRKALRAGVLRYTDAPAYAFRKVKPFEREHVLKVFALKDTK